jgi:hypothetical protein
MHEKNQPENKIETTKMFAAQDNLSASEHRGVAKVASTPRETG